MDEKDNIFEFITMKFKTTGWNFTRISEIFNHVGYLPKQELNDLYKEGKISVHDGIQGKLIKLKICTD